MAGIEALQWANLASWVLILAGGFLSTMGGLGLLRLPDFYARLHAGGITDTLGAWMLIAGMMVQAGLTQATIKLALMAVFILFTSPTSTHALARAALATGLRPWTRAGTDSLTAADANRERLDARPAKPAGES